MYNKKPEKNMLIYRLAAILETPGTLTSIEQLQEEAWQLVLFLRMNNLVSDDSLPKKKGNIAQDFKLMTNHITEEAFQVLKIGLDKWLDSNDNVNRKEVKMGVLERALNKVRKGKV
jgi:hypothetical protein